MSQATRDAGVVRTRPRRGTPLTAAARLTVAALVGLALSYLYLVVVIIGGFVPMVITVPVALLLAGLVATGWRPAPAIAALGLSAAAVGELIPNDPEGAASANEKLQKTIRATVGDVRRLVYDLRPPALDELGLVGAIEERAARLEADDGDLRVTVEAPDALPDLPAAVEVACYRIAQEALTNVSRHAGAGACLVRIACPGERVLQVEVEDDGIGLPERPEGGVGLHSMRERAEELGGTCEIGATPPSGTRVFARLPLAGLPAAPPVKEGG